MFKIGGIEVGKSHQPLIVAEISGNHRGSLEQALILLEKAKAAGIRAIKLQTYTPDTITLNIPSQDFLIQDASSIWHGRTLYDLYQEAYTPWEWHAPIFKRCQELGLEAFSTPFDETAVDFLETLNVPCYKIASLEIIDLPLIRKAASTKKPLIISTGGATEAEIDAAVRTARSAGCSDLILLKCTTAYPALPSDSHLSTIPDMEKRFGTLVGLSDHTLDLAVPIAGVALGACLIEKHFTLSRKEGGVDAAFSLEPEEFTILIRETKVAWEALGEVQYAPLPSEKLSLSLRPSLYFITDLPAGTVVTAEHIRSLRPAKGLPPQETDQVIGSKLKEPVKRGTPVSWNVFE